MFRWLTTLRRRVSVVKVERDGIPGGWKDKNRGLEAGVQRLEDQACGVGWGAAGVGGAAGHGVRVSLGLGQSRL